MTGIVRRLLTYGYACTSGRRTDEEEKEERVREGEKGRRGM
jgi:hypothetical protein